MSLHKVWIVLAGLLLTLDTLGCREMPRPELGRDAAITVSPIGLYDFEQGTGKNRVSGSRALPDLTAKSVAFGGGDAIFDSPSDYLQLAEALGSGPFTIYIEATYDPAPNAPGFAVSQRGGSNYSSDTDFVIRQFPGTTNQVTFYNGEGTCADVNNGSVDGNRHRIAITWDGTTVGNLFDGTLLTSAVSGTLPDIDGSFVRFGNATLSFDIGATGRVHQIQIFDRALSKAQLYALAGETQ